MSWVQVIPGVTLTKVTLLNNFLLKQYSAETTIRYMLCSL